MICEAYSQMEINNLYMLCVCRGGGTCTTPRCECKYDKSNGAKKFTIGESG